MVFSQIVGMCFRGFIDFSSLLLYKSCYNAMIWVVAIIMNYEYAKRSIMLAIHTLSMKKVNSSAKQSMYRET